MYEWDRDLLYRAVDLQLELIRRGRDIQIELPVYNVDRVSFCDYSKPIGEMSVHMDTNEELEEALDKLEKELSQDVKDPGTESNSCETLQSHYRKEEEESQE